MKKKVVYFIGGTALVVLMAINVNLGMGTEGNSFTISSVFKKALAEGEGAPYCYNGGPGASQCSIDAGINIAGYGISAGGSVTCNAPLYACCTLRCTCESA